MPRTNDDILAVGVQHAALGIGQVPCFEQTPGEFVAVVVLIGTDLLTLSAEGPPIKCDGLMTQAESFFDSLQVTLHSADP